MVDGHGAVRVAAGAVHGSEGVALGGGGGAVAAADVEGSAVAVEHDRQDVGVAAHPPEGGHREGDAVGGLAHPGIVKAGDQGVVVDEGDDLGDASGGLAGGDGGDDGVGLSFGEAAVVVGLGVPEPFELGVDGGPDGGVADGVELEQRAVHARDLVDPALDAGVASLAVELVGVGARCSELADDVAHLAGEGVHAGLAGDRQQCRFLVPEPGAQVVVDPAQGGGDGVEVAGGDLAGGEGCFEGGRRGADVFAFGDRRGFLGRSAPGAGVQRFRWFGAAGVGQLAGSSCAAHVVRVEP